MLQDVDADDGIRLEARQIAEGVAGCHRRSSRVDCDASRVSLAERLDASLFAIHGDHQFAIQ